MKISSAAVDLGATSGRVIVGTWHHGRVTLDEVHRFPNAFRTLGANAYWEPGTLWEEIRRGLQLAKKKYRRLASVGVDSWAVDHALVDRQGRLMYPVHAYRDTRTQAAAAALSERQQEKLYAAVGLPAYPYNTSFQLQETFAAAPWLRKAGVRVLCIADYVNFLLSGRMENEFSLCSHTQLLDVNGLGWSGVALKHFGVPAGVLGEPALSPQKLGKVKGLEELAEVEVVMVPGHDTACAFAAMPAVEEGGDLFLSSGTWSLLGFESDEPVLGKAAREAGISNERSGDGRYRPLCSSLGLWLWEKTIENDPRKPQDDAQWAQLIEQARKMPVPKVLIDCSDKTLFNPENMKVAVGAHLRARGGKVPRDLAGWLNLICHSLGQSHALAAKRLAALSGKKFNRILMVGGGSKNPLLAQATADACGLPVRAMNLEGSAVGNLAHQWIGLGVVKDLAAFRLCFEPQCRGTLYKPQHS